MYCSVRTASYSKLTRTDTRDKGFSSEKRSHKRYKIDLARGDLGEFAKKKVNTLVSTKRLSSINNACICGNGCDGRKSKLGAIFPECIKFHYSDPDDNGPTVLVLVTGDSTKCSDFARSYNKKIGNYTSYLDALGDYHSQGGSKDHAFRLISVDFKTMFRKCESLDTLCERQEFDYAEVYTRILYNILEKFIKGSTNVGVYQDIVKNFTRYNRLDGVAIQLDPYFSLSWGLAGQSRTYPARDTISRTIVKDFNGSEVTCMQFTPKHGINKFDDLGCMLEIFHYLKSNRDKSVILQVTAPDGRWIVNRYQDEAKAARYSDVQFLPTIRGKGKLGESPQAAAVREFEEEIGIRIAEKDLKSFVNEKKAAIYMLSVDNMV